MTAPCAIYLGSSDISLKHNPFGKDVANLGLYRALARYAPGDELPFLSFQRMDSDAVAAELYQGATPSKTITTTSIFNADATAAAGTLIRASGDIADLAWMRRHGGDRVYSISGLIHSLAPPAMRDYIANVITAPIQPWDTIWCTSPSVRGALTSMYEEYSDFLAGRFGGMGTKPRPFPAMPVIPLGVEVDEIQERLANAGTRAEMRAELNIADDEIVVLWVGRLSFFEKAHPVSMFTALEETAKRTGAKIRMLNVGWFPGGDLHHEVYEEAARNHAPSVKVDFLDGNERRFVDRVWGAADIFISLVDNIQETFGITPIEAMAAGLPLVMSDWDGYRASATNGVEGFLIPTLMPPPGSGWLMGQRHVLHMDSYQGYAGAVCMHTAVDIGAAVTALEALVREPDLRWRMGEAGKARARSMFNWPDVIEKLCAHWAEQEERRRTDSSNDAEPERFLTSSVKGDPYTHFQGFATTSLAPSTVISIRVADPRAALRSVNATRMDLIMERFRAVGPDGALEYLIVNGASRVDDLATALERPLDEIERLVVWMAKVGLVTWSDVESEDA
jgi:D-inositol-3-phosphate glycosyltransferase